MKVSSALTNTQCPAEGLSTEMAAQIGPMSPLWLGVTSLLTAWCSTEEGALNKYIFEEQPFILNGW